MQAGRIDEVVALCAGEGAFDEVVAAHGSGDTLAANESFQKLESEADDWALLWFLDVDELMTELAESQDVDPGGFLGRRGAVHRQPDQPWVHSSDCFGCPS